MEQTPRPHDSHPKTWSSSYWNTSKKVYNLSLEKEVLVLKKFMQESDGKSLNKRAMEGKKEIKLRKKHQDLMIHTRRHDHQAIKTQTKMFAI